MPITLPTTRSRTKLHGLTSKPQLHRRTTPTKPATRKSTATVSHTRHSSTTSTPPSPDLDATDYKDTSDDFFGVSFQQYCSVCDKLIPSNATLYCSSACRQKDSRTANSLPIFRTDITPPVSPSAATFYGEDPVPVVKDIVTQRSPSIRPRHASASSYYGHDRSGSDPEVLAADVEQALSASLRRGSRDVISPFTSISAQLGKSLPATSVLSQYGRTPSTTNLSGQNTAMPSSSQTTTPSPALMASPGSYTPMGTSATRRPNPRWSSTSFGSRGIDLVTPISAGYSDDAEDLQSTYEDAETRRGSIGKDGWRGSSGKIESGRGTFKEMFRFERMRGDAGTPGVR
jgi:hypothetical protein